MGASLIHIRKGWDQIEGEIDPKSAAGRRTIPILAILRDFLDEQLLRTGRTGDDRIFGRSADRVFYASTVDNRAKGAWTARNLAEREAAEEEGRTANLLTLLTMHECRHTFALILIDTGANTKAIQEVMGHSKVAVVESGELRLAEAFCHRQHSAVNEADFEVGVSAHQLCGAFVVGGGKSSTSSSPALIVSSSAGKASAPSSRLSRWSSSTRTGVGTTRRSGRGWSRGEQRSWSASSATIAATRGPVSRISGMAAARTRRGSRGR